MPSRTSPLHLVVTGPRAVEEGAPNTFQIQTRDQNGQLVPSHLEARVVVRPKGAKISPAGPDVASFPPEANPSVGQLIHPFQKDSPGSCEFTLPADALLAPNSEVLLDVVAQRPDGSKEEVHESLDLAKPLYVTHLATDKPMYRPGETVRFRSLTLERFSMKPPDKDFIVVYTLRTPLGEESQLGTGSSLVSAGENGSPLLGPDNKPIRGVGTGEIMLDPNAAGGEYTLKVSEAQNRFPPQERKFIVNNYPPQQLNKELDFNGKSYGPGDEVAAVCKVSRVEGGTAVANQPVECHGLDR